MTNTTMSEGPSRKDHSQTAATAADTPSVLPARLILGLILLPVLAVGGAVALFGATGRDWWVLLRDPATAFDFAPYAGLFSHLGVLAMTAAGAILVFASALLPRAARTVPVYAGVFTLWLALDDLFMLHESLIPRLIGLPEPLVLGLYVVVAFGLMRLIGPSILSRRYLGFWLAAGFLALMVATDMLVKVATSPSFLVEETAKIVGFVLWSAFWIAEVQARLREEDGQRP